MPIALLGVGFLQVISVYTAQVGAPTVQRVRRGCGGGCPLKALDDENRSVPYHSALVYAPTAFRNTFTSTLTSSPSSPAPRMVLQSLGQ